MPKPPTFEDAHAMAAELVRTYEDLDIPVFVVVMEPGGAAVAAKGEPVRAAAVVSRQMAMPHMGTPLSNAITTYSHEWEKAVRSAAGLQKKGRKGKES